VYMPMIRVGCVHGSRVNKRTRNSSQLEAKCTLAQEKERASREGRAGGACSEVEQKTLAWGAIPASRLVGSSTDCQGTGWQAGKQRSGCLEQGGEMCLQGRRCASATCPSQ
jgi:hypothetical protein